MEIEGDWSSAACFLVAGAVFGKADLAGLDTRFPPGGFVRYGHSDGSGSESVSGRVQ